MRNTEIERKYFMPTKISPDLPSFDTVAHDRYFTSALSLVRLRDDLIKGIEFTAKTYRSENNLHRTEVNLSIPNNSIEDCLQFAEIAGMQLRLEFKQKLIVWLSDDVVISETLITDLYDKPYTFDLQSKFISTHYIFPIARFVEIEVLNPKDPVSAVEIIDTWEDKLHLSSKDIIPYSLIQLFGAFPMEIK